MKLNIFISFLRKDDELLKKYNEIGKEVKNSLKKEFDSKPLYNEKYLKAKRKTCNGKVNTNFTIIKYQKRFSIHLLNNNFARFYF